LIIRYERSIGYLAIKAEYSQFNSVSVTFVSGPHPPHNPLAHPRVEYLDNGVADGIALLVGFSGD
jgi:hypothetical protein